MNVAVFGQQELVEHLSTYPDAFTDFDLISIGNPKSEIRKNPGSTLPRAFSKRFKNVLRLSFWDIERVELLGKLTPPVLVQMDDVQKILNFYQSSTSKNFVIHCWAGVSRSAAVAMCLLYLSGLKEKEALERLLSIRPQAAPLLRIIEMFDQISTSRLREIAQEHLVSYYAKMKQDLDLDEDSLLEELKEE